MAGLSRWVGALLLGALRVGYGNDLPTASVKISFQPEAGTSVPVVLSRTEPVYSDDGFKAYYQAVVKVSLVVGLDGKAEEITVVQRAGLGLDENTVTAVRSWVFEPGKRNGSPVRVAAPVEANFRLRPWQQTRIAFTAPEGVAPPQPTLRYLPIAGAHCGPVTLGFRVDVDGTPKDMRVVRAPDGVSGESLMQSLRTWRFRAARREGQAVPSEGEVDIDCPPWPEGNQTK